MNHITHDRSSLGSELREFLKGRRARIRPEEIGIRVSGRRRTSGLTREDMAHLAGVSCKWYGRFESGAAPGVSRGFLERVSGALKLNRVERRYLYGLLGFVDAPVADAVDVAPPSSLVPLVRELGTVPAAVFSSLFDLESSNDSYDALFGQAFRPEGVRSNLLLRLFFEPSFRDLWCQWGEVTRRAVGALRFMNRAHLGLQAYAALTEALSASAEFRNIWYAGEVCDPTESNWSVDLASPVIGKATFRVSTLVQSDNPSFLLVALIPADRSAKQRIEMLRRGSALALRN